MRVSCLLVGHERKGIVEELLWGFFSLGGKVRVQIHTSVLFFMDSLVKKGNVLRIPLSAGQQSNSKQKNSLNLSGEAHLVPSAHEYY